MRGKEFEELLAADMQSAAGAPEPSAGLAPAHNLHVVIKERLREARESASMIGRMPPAPPTVRAKAGSFLVKLIQRMLFWYTPQITGFNSAILGLGQEQNKLIERLLLEVNGLHREKEQAQMSVAALQGALASLQAQASAAQAQGAVAQARLDAVQAAFSQFADETRAQNEDRTRQAETRFTALDDKFLQLRTMFFAQQRPQSAATSARHEQPTPETAPAPGLDDLYLMLEDRLRGSRAEIKSRLLKYLPLVENEGSPRVPVIDLGSGRGEWLEVLRDHSFEAEGVDTNNTFLTFCSGLGLTVIQDDAVRNLESRAAGSAGMITGFHIIEHLGWGPLVRLLDESLRVLKPGGAVIFETPNPDNTLVGSRNFYLDPTHKNPLPSMLMQFLLEARGFTQVEVLPLHPCPDETQVPNDGSAIVARFNQFFFGPQDYAVIGRKPAGAAIE